MSRQEADEEALLALLTALALAGNRNAEELGILAGFVATVGDVLALLSVVLAAEENLANQQKAKEDAERLEARLKRIEERLAALAAGDEGKGKK